MINTNDTKEKVQDENSVWSTAFNGQIISVNHVLNIWVTKDRMDIDIIQQIADAVQKGL